MEENSQLERNTADHLAGRAGRRIDHAANAVDIPLHLERESATPAARQLTVQLRDAILAKRLAPGTRLPSTRALARALGVSRTVTLSAYDDLLAEGYLTGRPGSGTYVSREIDAERAFRSPSSPVPLPNSAPRWLRQPPVSPAISEPPRPDVIEFRAGRPAVAPLSDDAWRRAWRRAADLPLPVEYAEAAGSPELRAQIAAYLRRSRGLLCDEGDVIVTSGAIQGLHLLARATLAPGDAAAIEDPGYRLAAQVLRERGAQLIPAPVDGDGLRVGDLPVGGDAPLLVYTTPSHQFPLGVRLSLPRRSALLAWASAHDSLIVEDDYDGEFRYDAAPLPALAALDTTGRVAYIGTFSKVLSPALRVGYVVAPAPLRERLAGLKTIADYHTSWPVQRALAFFMESGDLDRHLRRMRRLYAHKRAALEAALAPARPWARIGGLEAGFHAHLALCPGIEGSDVARRAAERGVMVETLAPFYLDPPAHTGLLLGYGGLEITQIERGGRVLAAAIAEAAGAAQAS